MDAKKTIYELMPLLMKEVEAVGKDHRNDHHKYKYRSVDDLMTAVYKVLTRHGVSIIPRYSEPNYTDTAKGVRAVIRLELDWVAQDGSKLTTSTYGEGTDVGDKSAYKCMAGAFKYAILQTLCIPTDEVKDPEGDTSVDRDAPGQGAPKRTKRASSSASNPVLAELDACADAKAFQALLDRARVERTRLPSDSPDRDAITAAVKAAAARLGVELPAPRVAQ